MSSPVAFDHQPTVPAGSTLADVIDRRNQLSIEAVAGEYLCSLSRLVGLPFVAVKRQTLQVAAKTHSKALVVVPGASLTDALDGALPRVIEFDSGLLICAVDVPCGEQSDLVGLGWMLSRPNVRPSEVVLAAVAQEWSQQQLDKHLSTMPYCTPNFLERTLQTAVAKLDQQRRELSLQDEVAQFSTQLGKTYEEITLVHSLARNLQVSKSPADIAELCLDGIHGRIDCEGNAMWIRQAGEEPLFLIRGELPFEQQRLVSLIGRFEEADWSRPRVINHLADTSLGTEFPGLHSLVIVPIGTPPQVGGWVLSWNLRHEREYGTVEASWLNSVATIFGTHLRNIELFRENADLLLSFVRSLVSTLDAKDPYTRGHSERVALIARRIGAAMNLPNAELKDIYLAGLLHDIGKIGVDDSILRKPGSLTREEFAEIQKHPGVGYAILQGVKNLQSILPGVRNHHESYNGTGYPDQLKGEEIPLMARILAVADSYDAMGSDRPYRKGMPVETIHDIFRRGAGQQWDEQVIDAYFSVWTDISRLCAEYVDGDTGLLASQTNDLPATAAC